MIYESMDLYYVPLSPYPSLPLAVMHQLIMKILTHTKPLSSILHLREG